MKNLSYILLTIGVLFHASSCDNNFEEWNTNVVDPTELNPVYQLNHAILNCAFPNGTLSFDIGAVQQIITPNSGLPSGANFNQDNRVMSEELWVRYYREVILNTKDILINLEADEETDRNNLIQMARIIQVFAFMVLTDDYGSIPYFEGGLGFSQQIFLPAYDSQEVIYADLIQELTEATAALSESGVIETDEILFDGDITKWREFGYSLLLRAGMHLSEVNPAAAQQAVQAAFNGGVILSNANNAIIWHDPNYTNTIGSWLNATEAANFYLAEPFVNHLKNTEDPRLPAIAVTYVGAASGSDQVPANASYDPANLMGMPMGVDNNAAAAAATQLGLTSFYEFAQVDRNRINKLTAPTFLVTASQNNLLLAEARYRGWISNGSVEDYYNAGIRAHMNQMGMADDNSTVPAADASAYLSSNPLIAGQELEQIGTQYWISSFLNGPEAFANFRRTGFPVLEPNPYPGREVEFINRVTYPNAEISVNSENVSAAIAEQGPDNLETKVWWAP